jgi:hypothetical protein
MTWRDLLARWRAVGLLTDEAAAQVEAGMQQEEAKPSATIPWYVRVLVIVSAWVAALLFMVFLFGMDLFDFDDTAAVLGVVFIAGAIGLRRWAKGLFLQQMAFAISVTGQATLLFGLADLLDEAVLSWTAALVLQLLLFVLYPDGAHRFVSAVVAVATVLGLLYTVELQEGAHGVTAVLVAGAVVLWEAETRLRTGRFAALQGPLAYAVAFSLLLLFALAVVPLEVLPVIGWWPSTLVLAMGLLGLLVWIIRAHQPRGHPPLVLALALAVVLVAVLTHDAPGVLAAVLVLVLGFHRHNRVLMGLALLALALYLGWFYYHMHLSLLNKSLLLMGTGAVLLALRWGMGRFFQLERHATA